MDSGSTPACLNIKLEAKLVYAGWGDSLFKGDHCT